MNFGIYKMPLDLTLSSALPFFSKPAALGGPEQLNK